MKSEQEILTELEKLKGQIKGNLEEHDNELERDHPISVKVHWEYHNYLLGNQNALEWVLKDNKK